MILLVEDNPDDELLTLRALRKLRPGASIRVARDGRHAITEIERDTPRLVLLDLKLPYVDGHGVLAAMRARDASRFVPVVVLTTSTEPGDVEKAYRLGANSFVQKPIDYIQFVEVARRIVDYWLDTNRVPHTDSGEGADGDNRQAP